MAEETTGFGDEDFGFGFDEPAAASADPSDEGNQKPVVPAPDEDSAKRTHTTIHLRWAPMRQGVSKLLVQCMPNTKGKGFADGFDRSEKGNGKIFTIEPPQTATELVVAGLQERTEYVFRMVAKNRAGFTEGPSTPGIMTTAYAPLRGDKSGWLVKLDEIKPKIQEEKTGSLLRRLSFMRKTEPQRLWFVLDGALLSWFDGIDGKEEGYCHLGKLKELSWPSVANNNRFRLDFNDGKAMIEIACVSETPTMTHMEYFDEWTKEITAVRARVGNAQALHRRNSAATILT